MYISSMIVYVFWCALHIFGLDYIAWLHCNWLVAAALSPSGEFQTMKHPMQFLRRMLGSGGLSCCNFPDGIFQQPGWKLYMFFFKQHQIKYLPVEFSGRRCSVKTPKCWPSFFWFYNHFHSDGQNPAPVGKLEINYLKYSYSMNRIDTSGSMLVILCILLYLVAGILSVNLFGASNKRQEPSVLCRLFKLCNLSTSSRGGWLWSALKNSNWFEVIGISHWHHAEELYGRNMKKLIVALQTTPKN